MKTYRAAVIGCSRMGAFIDNEVVGAPGHVPPYSHTAVYAACDRTDLIACSDLRPEVMEKVGKQYDIPTERQYTDYKALIDKEQPEIVSVATQPEHRAELVIYAAEHGAKAIYAEKAMAASMAEADAMVEVCEQNGVLFNLGTQRRWHPGFTKMKEVIDSGRLGAPKTIIFNGSTLFNGASHHYDNLLFLNSDRRAVWVQAHLIDGNWTVEGTRLTEDPVGGGIIQFENGVTAYAVTPSREIEWEVNCEHGSLTAWPGGVYRMREAGSPGYRGRATMTDAPFPDYEPASPNLRLVEDLVHALDTGEPLVGGVGAAHAGTELIFATIASHLRGGARVELPLKDSAIRLQRVRDPRQPRYGP
ncbi:MAG: Gfo/Idh/MocA family oxidoreductase [Candidatus Poribacteria bacterium]|nr:Gfo/Idh/MocA family oxidoreductase [Candidatus Poribacteria bacterium]